MAKFQISRRKFLTASSLGLSGIALSGCDAFDSGLGIEQLERYSVEAPVAVIVRDPGAISLPADLPNPVGALAWQDSWATFDRCR